MKQNDICDNRIYILTSRVIYLLITNLFFLVSISPCIIYFLMAGVSLSIPILFFLGILIGPAIATMFSVTNLVITNKQNSAVKDYLHFYKLNLGQGLLVAVILNTFLMIFYIDIIHFSSNGNILMMVIFIFLALIVGTLSVYIYPILSRINVKVIDLFTASIKIMFKKLYLTLTIISLIVIIFAAIKLASIALVAVLFGTSAICYVILKLENGILIEVEKFFKEKYLI